MIKRGPGFLAVVYDIALSIPPPLPHVSKLDRQHTRRLRKIDNLPMGEWGEGGGGGARS